ncbi:GNAT family N-acetyltransferase [Thermococcus sp. Bubb.Bath]|nr:GNAT family N-acetyltransferase [Thermococcus sp. Bubb.Bath]
MEYHITDGEDFMDEIFRKDLEISWGFVRARISREEYVEAYWTVVNELLSHGEHKFFVALDPYNRYLGHVWVCITEDTVDFIPVAYIYDIETVEEARGWGIGSELLKKAEEWAKERGALKVLLRVDIDNPAVGWYKRRGYTERAVIMEKPLPG